MQAGLRELASNHAMDRPTPKALPESYDKVSEMLEDLGTPQDIIDEVKNEEAQGGR